MVVPPAVTVPDPLVLLKERTGACTVSLSTAHPGVGAAAPLHAPAVVEVGVLVRGSPPPPASALLVRVPVALALIFTVKPKTLVPVVAAIAVVLVHVSTLLAAVQLQFAASVPLSVTAPLAMVIPLGNTSTTVIVPVVGTLPVLLTVRL